MKKRLALILGGSAALLLLLAAPTFADAGPHGRATSSLSPKGSCASCHRAHTAEAPTLLNDVQPALCYECHGETGQGGELNVQGGVEYPTGTTYDLTTTGFSALRGGGFEHAALGANTSGQTIPAIGGDPNDPTDLTTIGLGSIAVATTRGVATSAHSVDPTKDVIMWGNGGIASDKSPGKTVQLTCTSCHDPHGNGAYRILRSKPTNSGTTSPVVIADETSKVYTTTNYWNVAAANSTDFIAKISAWCSTCHSRYLADQFDSSTSSGDKLFAYRHETDATKAYAPTCIQCHVSHGSNETMSRSALNDVLYPDGTGPNAMGNSRLLRAKDRSVCQMCHLR